MKTKINIRDQRGAAFIEFALVAPILLLLLFGIIEFSLLLYNKAMITNASREGARLGIVYNPVGGLTHPPCGDIQTRVERYAGNHLITFADPKPVPSVTRCVYGQSQDPTVPCPSDCNGFGSEVPGDFLRVEVSYPYNWLIIDIMVGWAIGSVMDLGAVSIMRFE